MQCADGIELVCRSRSYPQYGLFVYQSPSFHCPCILLHNTWTLLATSCYPHHHTTMALRFYPTNSQSLIPYHCSATPPHSATSPNIVCLQLPMIFILLWWKMAELCPSAACVHRPKFPSNQTPMAVHSMSPQQMLEYPSMNHDVTQLVVSKGKAAMDCTLWPFCFIAVNFILFTAQTRLPVISASRYRTGRTISLTSVHYNTTLSHAEHYIPLP